MRTPSSCIFTRWDSCFECVRQAHAAMSHALCHSQKGTPSLCLSRENLLCLQRHLLSQIASCNMHAHQVSTALRHQRAEGLLGPSAVSVQAFITREHLAVVTEHGPGGVLSDYMREHSSGMPGIGIREEVARCALQSPSFSQRCLQSSQQYTQHTGTSLQLIFSVLMVDRSTAFKPIHKQTACSRSAIA